MTDAIVNMDNATKVAVWALGVLQVVGGTFIVFVYNSIVKEHARLQKQSDDRNTQLQARDSEIISAITALSASFVDCRLHHEAEAVRVADLKRIDNAIAKAAEKEDVARVQHQVSEIFLKLDKMEDLLISIIREGKAEPCKK